MTRSDREPEHSPHGDVSASDEEQPAFPSAEAWLAARGVERQPLAGGESIHVRGGQGDAGGHERAGVSTASVDGPALSARDADRLAAQSHADVMLREGDARALPDPAVPRLEDDVADALAFVRRSTAVAPQAEGRLRTKLTERGWPSVVVERALEQARRERIVDDAALAGALVDERRARGHAVARIRRDLHDRGFDDDIVASVLQQFEREDPEAAAFDIAERRASQMTAVPAEKAFTRVVGYLVRRGYPDGLARKVSREAVFATRDDERISGH